MNCSRCKKHIWIWNKFYREYGKGKLIDIKNNTFLSEVAFCSEDCCFKYKKNFDINFNKSNLKTKCKHDFCDRKAEDNGYCSYCIQLNAKRCNCCGGVLECTFPEVKQ